MTESRCAAPRSAMGPPGVRIRSIKLEDAEGLARCKPTRDRVEIDAQVEWAVREQADGRLSQLVADEAGRVVGTVCIVPRGAVVDIDGSRTGYVLRVPPGSVVEGQADDWFVDPARQRRGIGRALLTAAIHEAWRWRLVRLHVHSTNPDALSVIRSVGFTESEAHTTSDGSVDRHFLLVAPARRSGMLRP
jgi:GNAT superfamily N-acetyltransferase